MQITHHSCFDPEEWGLSVISAGHYATETLETLDRGPRPPAPSVAGELALAARLGRACQSP